MYTNKRSHVKQTSIQWNICVHVLYPCFQYVYVHVIVYVYEWKDVVFICHFHKTYCKKSFWFSLFLYFSAVIVVLLKNDYVHDLLREIENKHIKYWRSTHTFTRIYVEVYLLLQFLMENSISSFSLYVFYLYSTFDFMVKQHHNSML